ncbi:DNA primase protein [Rhizobium phage RHph_I1_18]|nr:DNA primase protein [Rhizobium phage RHph_I1_18]
MALDSLFVQKSYADQLSSRLQLFVKKNEAPYLANFRCDVCGDSVKRKHVKRGYIFTSDKGNLMYYCQNCSINIPFQLYLEQYHGDLYKRYIFEVIGNRGPRTQEKASELIRERYEPSWQGLEPIQDLSPNHECIKYLISRRLPASKCKRLFYTEKFFAYVNSVIPEKFPDFVVKKKDHPRLILPLLTKEGEMFGVIGRALSNDVQTRYMTIKFDENYPKIFGLDQVDFAKHIHFFEGPIDSLFLDNSLALAGTDADISQIIQNKSRFTIVLDNQPRNKEVVEKYRKYVYHDYNVVVWPKGLPGKDVNDLILNGYSPDTIKKIIRENTHRGQMATVMFNNWRKV